MHVHNSHTLVALAAHTAAAGRHSNWRKMGNHHSAARRAFRFGRGACGREKEKGEGGGEAETREQGTKDQREKVLYPYYSGVENP